jgi:hypothetical protein
MRTLARLHGLDAGGWERHANPWSVWTRVPILPAAALVLLARETLGAWTWVMIAGLAGWALVNPRAFPPPASTASWASRAVLGERLWLEQGRPADGAIRLSLALSAAGLLPLAWGIVRLSPTVALVGLAITLAGKFLFLHYMVRRFDAATADDDPMVRAWRR